MADLIKKRRLSLGLSVEEAARRAGIGTKTWFRYESAGSIRRDKVAGVCKALAWTSLPSVSDRGADSHADSGDYAWLESIDESDEGWSASLAKTFGRKAAVSFVVGSAVLDDYLGEDLEELSRRPKGTHVGEIPCSWVADLLPGQFLMRYDYEFIFHLRAILRDLRGRAHYGNELLAHTVAEELLVRLIRDFSFDSVDGWSPEFLSKVTDEDVIYQETEGWKEWPEEICSDDDLTVCLNDGVWSSEGQTYHFDTWFVGQFFMEDDGNHA